MGDPRVTTRRGSPPLTSKGNPERILGASKTDHMSFRRTLTPGRDNSTLGSLNDTHGSVQGRGETRSKSKHGASPPVLDQLGGNWTPVFHDEPSEKETLND